MRNLRYRNFILGVFETHSSSFYRLTISNLFFTKTLLTQLLLDFQTRAALRLLPLALDLTLNSTKVLLSLKKVRFSQNLPFFLISVCVRQLSTLLLRAGILKSVVFSLRIGLLKHCQRYVSSQGEGSLACWQVSSLNLLKVRQLFQFQRKLSQCRSQYFIYGFSFGSFYFIQCQQCNIQSLTLNNTSTAYLQRATTSFISYPKFLQLFKRKEKFFFTTQLLCNFDSWASTP